MRQQKGLTPNAFAYSTAFSAGEKAEQSHMTRVFPGWGAAERPGAKLHHMQRANSAWETAKQPH